MQNICIEQVRQCADHPLNRGRLRQACIVDHNVQMADFALAFINQSLPLTRLGHLIRQTLAP